MADEALAQAGLHFDELNTIKVLEPEVFQQTTELKEECKDFVESKWFKWETLRLQTLIVIVILIQWLVSNTNSNSISYILNYYKYDWYYYYNYY